MKVYKKHDTHFHTAAYAFMSTCTHVQHGDRAAVRALVFSKIYIAFHIILIFFTYFAMRLHIYIYTHIYIHKRWVEI